MAASFNSGSWPASESQWSDEPHPSHPSTAPPLHSNRQPLVDHRSHLESTFESTFETPSLSSALSNYPYPSRAEQGALSLLKDYPDRLLGKWFELARQDQYGISFSAFLCVTNSHQAR